MATFPQRPVVGCAKYRIFSCMRVAGEGTNRSFSTVLATGVLVILGSATCALPEPSAILCRFESAGVAQLVEHLICNQRVGGSIPSASSTI